ncbi:hypothetical protein C8T65DRAFT_654546 [Cerioporus squamosus]|nr:hypothetical protein C8T65DRAFT_654546 [Cerioporus squamosus]
MVMSSWQQPEQPLEISDSEDDAPTEDHPPAPADDGPDVQPSTAYAIVHPGGPGVVNLTAQHVHMRKTVRAALPRLEAKLAFEDAFPDAITLAQNVHDTLVDVAHEFGYIGLEQALRNNEKVSGPISSIVKQRMSTYRGSVKKLADTHAAAYYQLKQGCAPLVTHLFDHLTYNYPFNYDPNNNNIHVFWNKPYGHEAYTAMLHASFFTGQNALGIKNASLFRSSLDTRPEEKEIPIPMLAFVGTAVHAAISEWRTGNHTHVTFSADAFLDVYNEHKILLNGIKSKNPRGFHSMMHRLYREASGAAATTTGAAITAANQALAFVDLAGMDSD